MPDQTTPDASSQDDLTAPGPTLGVFLRSLPGLRANPLQFIQNAANQYGDVVQFRVGGLNGFLLNNPGRHPARFARQQP